MNFWLLCTLYFTLLNGVQSVVNNDQPSDAMPSLDRLFHNVMQQLNRLENKVDQLNEKIDRQNELVTNLNQTVERLHEKLDQQNQHFNRTLVQERYTEDQISRTLSQHNNTIRQINEHCVRNDKGNGWANRSQKYDSLLGGMSLKIGLQNGLHRQMNTKLNKQSRLLVKYFNQSRSQQQKVFVRLNRRVTRLNEKLDQQSQNIAHLNRTLVEEHQIVEHFSRRCSQQNTNTSRKMNDNCTLYDQVTICVNQMLVYDGKVKELIVKIDLHDRPNGKTNKTLDLQSQLVRVHSNQTLDQQQEVTGSLLHQKKLERQVCRPVLTHVIRGDRFVNALTSFNNQLFVARYSIIAVYDTTTFAWIRNITGVGVAHLYGLAPCPTDNCLFVSDYQYVKVHKLNLLPTTGNDTTVTTTSWWAGGSPHGLSVNRQKNLLVVQALNKKIAEYTPNGSLVRELSDSNYLHHAVEHVVNGTFVVSRFGPVHDVALMVFDGRVIHSYGSTTQGSGPGQMNWPRSLAVTRDGYVLVADSGNDRILVINPTLSDARRLPLPTDASGLPLNDPYGLWLDESKGRLYVGEWNRPYRVLVYDNVFNVESLFSP